MTGASGFIGRRLLRPGDRALARTADSNPDTARIHAVFWQSGLSMCGIAGFWRPGATPDGATLTAMTEAIRYRGRSRNLVLDILNVWFI